MLNEKEMRVPCEWEIEGFNPHPPKITTRIPMATWIDKGGDLSRSVYGWSSTEEVWGDG